MGIAYSILSTCWFKFWTNSTVLIGRIVAGSLSVYVRPRTNAWHLLLVTTVVVWLEKIHWSSGKITVSMCGNSVPTPKIRALWMTALRQWKEFQQSDTNYVADNILSHWHLLLTIHHTERQRSVWHCHRSHRHDRKLFNRKKARSCNSVGQMLVSWSRYRPDSFWVVGDVKCIQWDHWKTSNCGVYPHNVVDFLTLQTLDSLN